MKPAAYLIAFLLLVPIQAGLFAPLFQFGIRPDLALAFLYAIGLVTSPREGAVAGIGLGLLLDLSSASLIGLSGLSLGALGLAAGFLGRRVLDLDSPSNLVFLTLFSLAQSLAVAFFLATTYGDLPFWSLVFRRMLPGAISTAVIGYFLLRFVVRRDFLRLILRRELQKER